jgi:imidazole glycerol-phosphate synthase subunit HisH
VSRVTVGIVDYGTGNHTSVRHALREIGVRCRISADREVLDLCDLLLLPGVGAFRPAVQALRERALDRYLLEQVERGRPLLGICLGMQLLAQASYEDGFERGLGLVPGEVLPLSNPRWHIGWNTIEQVLADPVFRESDGRAFYFNHSFAFQGPIEFQACRTVAGQPFASVVRRGKVVGVQFHPEKSQGAGRALLSRMVRGLCDA